MESRKQAICEALRTWINQRPGFDPNNYDRAGYLSDSRMVQRQLHDARELLRAVELSSITADALIAAFPQAFSGRLTIGDPTTRTAELRAKLARTGDEHVRRILRASINSEAAAPVRIEYCAGQYWCTEYRAAACAVLASALWTYTREECMPPVSGYIVREWGNRHTWWGPFVNEADADVELKTLTRQHSRNGTSWGTVDAQYAFNGRAYSAGDWLRAHFKQQFGRGIASRWFS